MGLEGVEDLGNGYSVGFQLEQGYNLDDGTTAKRHRYIHRESRLFVQGGFGTLSFGRFGSLLPLVQAPKPFLPVGSSALLMKKQAPGQKYGKEEITVSTMLFLMFLQPSAEQLCMPCIPTACLMMMQNGHGNHHHYYGLGIKTTVGALDGSVIFEATDAKGDAECTEPAYSITAGANYNFGIATVSGIYQYAWSSDEYKTECFRF